MKAIGEKLELDFDVGLARGGSKETCRFSDLLARPTVVSVYMRNNTSSCDKQMASLASSFKAIENLGFQVLGLSKDTTGSHVKFAARHGIPFVLVSDPGHHFARATDSMVEKKLYGRVFWGPLRAAYLLDSQGVLLGICDNVDSGDHGRQIETLIRDGS